MSRRLCDGGYAFGNQRNRIETDIDTDPNPFRYCAEYFDIESNTLYLRNRSYDARNGRFTQEDPIGSGLNWYSYCGGNPVAYADPSGLVPLGSGWNNLDEIEEEEEEEESAGKYPDGIILESDIEDFGLDSITLTALTSLNMNWLVASEEYKKEIEKLAAMIRRISYSRLKAGLTLDINKFEIPRALGSIKLNSTERLLLSDISAKDLDAYIMAAVSAKLSTMINFNEPVNDDGSRGNAYQHALWTFNLIEAFGMERAKIYTNAHEFGTIDTITKEPTYGSPATMMDLYNNERAQILYGEYQNYLASLSFPFSLFPTTPSQYILNAVNDGAFIYLLGGEMPIQTAGKKRRF